jgi:hypothetical protein
MDAIEFFRLRYDNLHPGVWERVTRKLTEAQIRTRPHPAANTIAWQIWHMARCEDVGVSRFVVDRAQVLDDENWLPRLGVGRRDIGTGMTDPEVDALSARVDLDALRDYWAAVGRRTLQVVDDLDTARLADPIDRERLDRVLTDEGMLGEHAGWVRSMWAELPNRGWFLAQLALTHNTGHLYQIGMLRGLWGYPGR